MSDEEAEVINERDHNALLRDIRQLDRSQKRRAPAVTKPTKKRTTFDKAAVLDDLVGEITSTRNVSELKKQFVSTDRKKRRQTLDKPLHRQARERVESSFAYKESRKELRSWDPIVHENRAAEQLVFPLNDSNTFFGTTAEDKSKSFTPRTDFEKKLLEALGKNKPTEDAEVDEELSNAMNLKEARKQTTKLRRMRALASYAAAKNARESRIKSKTFHRVRKREKRKKLIKEIEDLLEKDPEAAREKLKVLDQDRAFERATLKHRGTGKWSVQLRQYASKNPGMQRLITEHLKLGRELKSKHGLENVLKSYEEEEEEDSEGAVNHLTKAEMLELAAEQAKRELEAEQQQQHQHTIKKASENPELIDRLNAIRQRRMNEKEIVSVKLIDEDALPDSDDETEEDTHGFLAQAFNADDVVEEFADKKQKLEKESGSKAIDKRLFGWGSWTGPGISEERQIREKERYLTKTKGRARKDREKKGLIIREELADESLARFQPKDVPFPFTAVKDFEAVIRQPIGKDWNTQISHRNLIKKSIETKAGRIIRPMDKDNKLRRTTEAIFSRDDDD